MNRHTRLLPLLCLALLGISTTIALGLGGDLDRPGIAYSDAEGGASLERIMEVLEREDAKFLGGSFVNWFTTMYYGGDTKALNLFLEALTKVPGSEVHVSFVPEMTATTLGGDIEKPVSWSVHHDGQGARFHIRLNLASDQMDLEALYLPDMKGPPAEPGSLDIQIETTQESQ